MHYAQIKADNRRVYPMYPNVQLIGFGLRPSILDREAYDEFAVGNVIRHKNGAHYYEVMEVRTKYVKVQNVHNQYSLIWNYASMYEFVAVDQRQWEFDNQLEAVKRDYEYKAKQLERQQLAKAAELSRNTVTRALVHANDNDYCQETAIALISAGHKMPDARLRLSFNVTMDLTLKGNKNYYALRRLFGKTRGEVQGARLESIDYDGYVSNAIRQQFKLTYDDHIQDIEHLDTNVIWHEPTIRITDTETARDEFESETV